LTGEGSEIAALRQLIRSVPDFPRPGIVFRDATPLFADPAALRGAVELLAARLAGAGPVDVVFGAEARGFILGPALAIRLGAGFVPARRAGKLPAATERATYELEYGAAELHVHTDAIVPGARVVVHDDLIATGGTAAALGEIVERLGGEVVAYGFLIELAGLAGRERLAAPTHSLIDF
jgi:adenine phosphoribosyltransferase